MKEENYEGEASEKSFEHYVSYSDAGHEHSCGEHCRGRVNRKRWRKRG